MISFFRRALSSWVVLGLLGLIMVAFIVTGVGAPTGLGGGGTQGGGYTLATVGGKRLGSVDMTRRVQNQLESLKQREAGLTMTGLVEAGGVERTINEMIAATAVEMFGREQGVIAGRKLVDGEIASIAAFNGPTGKFDQATFEGLLARQRIPERAFREDIAADLVRRVVLGPIAAGTEMPASAANVYAGLLLETRKGSVGIVPASAFAGGAEPSNQQVLAFYRENILHYTVPERRALRYAVIGADQVAARATPTEADIAAAYKADAAKYAARDARSLSQVILPTQAAANAFAAKVKGGVPFATAASQAGFAAADIAVGEQSKTQFADMTSATVADAAFAAASGAITAPAKSDFGWHVVHVDAVRAVAGRTLAEVRGEIATALETQRRQDMLADLVSKIEDGIADGQSFDDAVKANGLTVTTTPPLLPSGVAPGQPSYTTSPDALALLRAAFETTTDEDPTVEQIAENQRYALLAVSQIVPAAPTPLRDISARVIADTKVKQAQDRAKAAATAIMAKINKGVPLATAIAQAGVALPPVQPIGGRRIDIAQQGANVPPPIVALFGMAANSAKIEAAPNGDAWFVIKLDAIEKGDITQAAQLATATQRQLSPALGQEYGEQFARAAEVIMGSKRDDKAVGRFKAELSGAAASPQ